ncbi:hypothetical protein EXS70_02770 [Candidatus Peribacteria bacterium]|nr:hypothetical protein [Candidatus Peribacteria bacterium]
MTLDVKITDYIATKGKIGRSDFSATLELTARETLKMADSAGMKNIDEIIALVIQRMDGKRVEIRDRIKRLRLTVEEQDFHARNKAANDRGVPVIDAEPELSA